MTKEAKKPKRKLDVGMVQVKMLEVVFYNKESCDVQTHSEVSYLHKLNGLRIDITKMAIVHTTLELVSQVVHANEVNVSLFDFLHHFLIWINQSDNPGKILFPYLQLQIGRASCRERV